MDRVTDMEVLEGLGGLQLKLKTIGRLCHKTVHKTLTEGKTGLNNAPGVPREVIFVLNLLCDTGAEEFDHRVGTN